MAETQVGAEEWGGGRERLGDEAPTVRPALAAGWRRRSRGRVSVCWDGARQNPVGFALEVARGLDDRPRWLESAYLYDAEGARLFQQISQQPEYYQTRTEDQLLQVSAPALRSCVGASVLVELGSGSSEKTRHLLAAWCAAGRGIYVPIDLDQESLAATGEHLAKSFPGLTVEAVAARYERALPLLSPVQPKLMAFLGSSLGNLGGQSRDELLRLITGAMARDDRLLLGLDLVKDPARLEAAYNDAAGVTAAFTRNLFARMNRELGSDIPLDAIRHVAYYDATAERIEIYAEFLREVSITLPSLGRSFRVARGERIRTEVSHKFRSATIAAELARLGLMQEWSAVDPGGSFGLFLFRKTSAGLSDGEPGAEETLRLLERVRQRTREIVAPLPEEELPRQPAPEVGPILWDLGHIAQFEEDWLVRRSTTVGMDPRARLYDPLENPRPGRHRLALPSVEETEARLSQVRQRAIQAVRTRARTSTEHPRLADELVGHLIAQHEAWHQETMLQGIALRRELRYPSPARACDPPVVPSAPQGMVLIPGGVFVMGAGDLIRSYDNERPAHEVNVPAFRIDVRPVTNGEYLTFMAEGGYVRRQFWSEEGWAWLQSTGARGPLHWRRAADGSWEAIWFGRRGPLDLDCPVVHVCYFEAEAFARWRGKRLPTEAEWEKAAAWDPVRGRSTRYPWGDGPSPGGDGADLPANVDLRAAAPLPVGCYPSGRSFYGCQQMIGDVWEWTSSAFAGYPGFVSFPYREYSEIFFGREYRVLRGGSFATAAILARATLRNWDRPERRQIFAGFRCAEDA